jgi:hypothetical protein
VIVQHLDSLDTVSEPLLAHPACPRCGTTTDQPGDGEPALAARITPSDVDDASGALDELNRSAPLVRANMGVFTAFADGAFTQMPLKVGRISLGVGAAVRRTITGFDVHNTVGARLTALHRAPGHRPHAAQDRRHRGGDQHRHRRRRRRMGGRALPDLR